MVRSLLHWKVLVNLLLAAAVFTGLVWLTFRWLELHTNHGKEVAVPNVVNMTVHNAIKVLDDSGLEYEVDSFKYDPAFRPYQVLQVFPSSGSHVKNGRTIILKVNPRTWAKVAVPDILDRYKGLAFRQLDLVGLKVGDTLYEPSIQRDAVIRMQYNNSTLKPGTLLPRFSVIDIVIGSGPKRNITMPNLVGLTVAEAKAVIAQNLFEVGLVEHEDGKQDDSDIIYYQDPEGGSIRDQGMQIDLWASKKTPAQMSAKITQLNSIYRVKIDTTAPPPSYYDAPTYPQPSIPANTPSERKIVHRKHSEEPADTPEQIPAEKTQPTEKTKVAVPKVVSPPATTQKKEAKPAETKPKSTVTPQEKPKTKKVIVE